jgi:hypothetical protein
MNRQASARDKQRAIIRSPPAVFGRRRSHQDPSTMKIRSLLAAAALTIAASPALAQTKDTMTSLFKVVSVKDEVVIGLNAAELGALGGR